MCRRPCYQPALSQLKNVPGVQLRLHDSTASVARLLSPPKEVSCVGLVDGFRSRTSSRLRVEVHRRCCICHRFCGYKIETDHIIPMSEEGHDDIENALPVC